MYDITYYSNRCPNNNFASIVKSTHNVMHCVSGGGEYRKAKSHAWHSLPLLHAVGLCRKKGLHFTFKLMYFA